MSSYTAPPSALTAAAEIDQTLAGLIAGSDLDVFTPHEIEQLLPTGATLRNRLDAWIAAQLRRLTDAHAHRIAGRTDVANRCAHLLGITPTETARISDTTERLGELRDVADAARNGCLSGREIELIVGVAADHPAAQHRLLAAAGNGIQVLKDECWRVRRECEPDGDVTKRLRRQRSYRSWFDDDGMYNGRFKLTPEIGAEVKAAIQDMQNHLYRNRHTGDADDTADNRAADALTALILANTPTTTTTTITSTNTAPNDPAAPTTTTSATEPAGDRAAPHRATPHSADTAPRPANGRQTDTRHEPSDSDLADHEPSSPTEEQRSDKNNVDRRGRTASPPTRRRRMTKTKEETEQADRLRDLGDARKRRRLPVNVIIDLTTLRRGQLHAHGRCEIPGIGPVSAAWVRNILPFSTLKIVVTANGTVHTVCHVGRRIPPNLLEALTEESPSSLAADKRPKGCYVIIVVVDIADLETPPTANGDLPNRRTVGFPGNDPNRHVVEIAGVGTIDGNHPASLLSPAGVDILARKSVALDDIVTDSRHIPARLLTALLVAGRECDEPGCNRRGYLEIDHTIEHSRGGLTCWRNNKYKCSVHHRAKTANYNQGRRYGKQPRERPDC